MSKCPDNNDSIDEQGKTIPSECISQVKPPICRLSIFSVVSFLLIIPLMILMFIFENSDIKEDILLPVLGSIAAFSVIGSPIIAVIAKIRIALSDGRLKGMKLTNIVIIGSSILLLVGGIMPSMGKVKSIAQRVVCATNLKGLGTAMMVYANDYDDQIPTASQWCDLLITHADVSPKSFICPSSDDVHGECSYALNKYAVGKKLSELPAGMVLLFETNIGRSRNERDCLLKNRDFVKKMPDAADKNPNKHKVHKERWNQVGGPEDLMNAHKEGSNFTFTDGHASYEKFRYPDRISDSVLEHLYWDESKTKCLASEYLSVSEVYENNKQTPPFPKSVTILTIVIVTIGIFIIFTTKPWKHMIFMVKVAFWASVIGFIFGWWAEGLYRQEHFKWVGAYGSAGIGFIAGMCYVGILMKLQNRLKNNESIRQLATSLGIAVGMICSTLLHLSLLLIHREPDGIGFMLAGLPFGIAGGAMLGAFSGGIVCKFYRPEKAVIDE